MTNELCHVMVKCAIPELHACNSGAGSRVACMQLWSGWEIAIAKILHASLLEIWQCAYESDMKSEVCILFFVEPQNAHILPSTQVYKATRCWDHTVWSLRWEARCSDLAGSHSKKCQKCLIKKQRMPKNRMVPHAIFEYIQLYKEKYVFYVYIL